MRRTFSIVICTLDRVASLETTLKALDQLRHPAFEVVVVNGPSQDGTADLLSRHADRLVGLSCPEANLAVARNIGWLGAQGEIIAFLDDDAVPEPDWLDELEPGFAAEDVGAVGGWILDHTGVAYQCRSTVSDRAADCRDFDEDDAERAARKNDCFLSPTGANVAYRRRALEDVRGFDETYAYFLDETDVNIRMHDAGWRIRFRPTARVLHKYAPSDRRRVDHTPTKLYLPARSKAYFISRYWRGDTAAVAAKREAAQRAQTASVRALERRRRISAEDAKRLIAEIETGAADGRERATQAAPLAVPSASPAGGEPIRMRRPEARTGRRSGDRLRLCFMSQKWTSSPEPGGIAMWTDALATGLAARGHEISVVTRADTHPSVDYERGVWVHRILPRPHGPSVPGSGVHGGGVHGSGERGASDSGIAANLPTPLLDYSSAAAEEALHIHFSRGLDFVSGPIWDVEPAVALDVGALPTAVSLHTTRRMKSAGPTVPLDDEIAIKAEEAVLRAAPFVLANSRAIIADVANAYDGALERADIALAHHGLVDIAPNGSGDGGDRSLHPPRVLFVGRLESRKGADTVLDALPDLLMARPTLEADIVGADVPETDGPPLRRDFLERWKSAPWLDRVRFHGHADPELLAELFDAADIVLAPSRYESFGLVFVEAMMFAKPVIAARAGAAPEVIEHGVCGLLVTPGDASELKSATLALLDSPSYARTLGEQARRRYEKCFTHDVMLDEVEAAFRRWLAAPLR